MTEQPVLVVRRVIAAPVERVFAAWTTPDLLRAWFGPAGVTCIAAEVDLRVGGAYKLGNRLPDARVVWITGTFERIEAPHKLVYTWRVSERSRAPVARGRERTDDDGDNAHASLVTVDFIARGTATEVIVTHERVATATLRDDHERGWNGCLDKLAAWAL